MTVSQDIKDQINITYYTLHMSDFKKQLRDSELTKVLADGFALLYHDKPKFPVTYLVTFMKAYNQKKIVKSNLIQKVSTDLQIVKNLEKQMKQQKILERQQQSQIKLKQTEEDDYIKLIRSTDNHEHSLDGFCDWVERYTNLTGVYIGALEHPDRKCDLDREDGEFVHLDVESAKVIKFKHSSVSHKFLINKTLTQESISGKMINQADNNNNEQAEEGQEPKETLPTGQVYIPSVVGNPELQFFRFPRLGAYFGVLMKVKTYLHEKCFDSNLIKTETFKKAKGEWDKEHEEKEAKFRELYDEKANGGGDEKQLEQMEKQFQLENSDSVAPKLEQFESVTRTFVAGFDTLGQDRQIAPEQRNKLKTYVQIFKQSWELKELTLLKTDIEAQFKLLELSEAPQVQVFTKMVEEDDKELMANEEVLKFKDNEKMAQLQLDTLRIERLKEHLVDQKYLVYLDSLMTMNVIKYPEIMQNFLYFLGNSKININHEGTSVLNWRQCKKVIEDRKLFLEAITTYNPRGSKAINVFPYAKWERILRNLEKYDATIVTSYNIYLAFILRFLQIVGKTRKNDREQRLIQFKKEVQSRNQRINEVERKKQEKKQKMQAAQRQAQEKQEQFDEAAWELAYDQENPTIEIGEEIQEQADEDLEEGSKKEVKVINE